MDDDACGWPGRACAGGPPGETCAWCVTYAGRAGDEADGAERRRGRWAARGSRCVWRRRRRRQRGDGGGRRHTSWGLGGRSPPGEASVRRGMGAGRDRHQRRRMGESEDEQEGVDGGLSLETLAGDPRGGP